MSKLSLSGTVLEIMVEHIIKQQRAGASSPRERPARPEGDKTCGRGAGQPGQDRSERARSDSHRPTAGLRLVHAAQPEPIRG